MKAIYIILGACAAGICIGLLVAPAKGNETRKKVAETTSDLAEKLKNLIVKAKKAKEGRTADSFSNAVHR
ncbi:MULTISPECIES: YtxH domain-containing protein [Niastella]|uniref:YtxH domain-containing protein n=1 Tax=Niastella soli TaxID=2821487 RepID=A0ABS3YYT2_9BACT|nr:YtxH domain-containing protein [Niastella soli]MBO9203091.1 YtxH domain-containing protein [Niastella soli]